MARPRDPPGIAIGGERIPAIDWVTPALPRRTEVIGRDPGDDQRLATLVQLEVALVRPHIRALVCDEDRQVADDRDATLARLFAQRRPLAVEEELRVAMETDLVHQLHARRRQRVRVTA